MESKRYNFTYRPFINHLNSFRLSWHSGDLNTRQVQFLNGNFKLEPGIWILDDLKTGLNKPDYIQYNLDRLCAVWLLVRKIMLWIRLAAIFLLLISGPVIKGHKLFKWIVGKSNGQTMTFPAVNLSGNQMVSVFGCPDCGTLLYTDPVCLAEWT
jgi:hypothetical protein